MESTPPYVIVENDEHAFAEAVEQLRASGWAVSDGWEIGAPASRTVFVGRLAGDADFERALLAALRGAGLVVSIRQADDGAAVFLEDLRRLGPIEIRSPRAGRPVQLDGDDRALVALLAEGKTVVEAARHLHLSRSTAQRRLVKVRRTLGAVSTAEAVRLARGLGLC